MITETTPAILIQYVIVQRDQVPTGQRILTDGHFERTTVGNDRPTPIEPLDRDRVLNWQSEGVITAAQMETIKAKIHESGFFNLQPKLLINYCKEDPGVGIWTVNVDGRQMRVVVYDPKPKRAIEIDILRTLLVEMIGE